MHGEVEEVQTQFGNPTSPLYVKLLFCRNTTQAVTSEVWSGENELYRVCVNLLLIACKYFQRIHRHPSCFSVHAICEHICCMHACMHACIMHGVFSSFNSAPMQACQRIHHLTTVTLEVAVLLQRLLREVTQPQRHPS
jgi:hypothetical protein